MEELLKQLLSEVKGIKSDLSELKEGQSRMDAKVSKLEEGQTRLESKVGKLEVGQDRLESKMGKLEIRIENEVIEKVRGLGDGWQVHEEKYSALAETVQQVNGKVDRMETNLGRIDLKLDTVIDVQSQHREILDVLAARSIYQEADIQTLKRAK